MDKQFFRVKDPAAVFETDNGTVLTGSEIVELELTDRVISARRAGLIEVADKPAEIRENKKAIQDTAHSDGPKRQAPPRAK